LAVPLERQLADTLHYIAVLGIKFFQNSFANRIVNITTGFQIALRFDESSC